MATPLLNPADAIPSKGWFFRVSGQSVEKEPVIEITGVNAVQVPLSGGGSSTIFSGSNSEIEMETESESVLATFGFNPGEVLQYQFRVGQIRRYELEFSSGAHTNKLDALDDGFVWGLGLGGRINPGSIVSVGISWQLDFTQSTVDLDRFQSPGVLTDSRVRFQEEEYQGSVNFSHRWKTLEPYAGLKIIKTVAKMTDTSTKSKVRGETEGISPFVGLQWAIAQNEAFAIESSFVDEKSLSAAFKIQF